MTSDFPALLDACVLVQAAVRHTLLRLFERRLYLARWTDEIIEETVRNLQKNLRRTLQQTGYLVNELRTHFPDAWVEPGYRELIPVMKNHEKDRHVVVHELHQQGAELKKPRSINEVLTSLEICKCTQFTQLIREKLELSCGRSS